MARASESRVEQILELLASAPNGLDVASIVRGVAGDDGAASERTLRNLLNRLVDEGKIVKRRQRAGGTGAPPHIYFHPDRVPQQLSLLDDVDGVRDYRLSTKDEIEKSELEQDELGRQEVDARSVLDAIAVGHLHEERYAQAIIQAAPKLAAEQPAELLAEMAAWVVGDLNRLGEETHRAWRRGRTDEAEQLASELDYRLKWAKRYFQRFWRLDRSLAGKQGAMDLPARAKDFLGDSQIKGSLNRAVALETLKTRVFGERVLDEWNLPTDVHKAAAGTDASVADIFLEHVQGSFIPPDPVVVTAAAAALKTRSAGGSFEYQDFDVFPDRLREYQDHAAAVKGLVISPLLKQILPERDFKHSRMAAMELRQYSEDLRVSQKKAEWRPVGIAPALGINPKPTLILRDGRMFPLVHRLKDYEDDGLYGQIVRNQIESFAYVIHHTLSSPVSGVIYGAVVKSPEMSWLSPLVFWYLHVNAVKVHDEQVVNASDVYRFPFPDTAVSHLLFLGNAANTAATDGRVLVTFRAVRRFSDIAIGEEESLPVVIQDPSAAGGRLIDEDKLEDWEEFVGQRIQERRERFREGLVDLDDYRSFIYLCSRVGASMCYAAPKTAYRSAIDATGEPIGHFLLPRLEVSVDMQQLNEERKTWESLLSWLAGGGIELDRAHTQSAFDTGEQEAGFPILVPDVVAFAHEVVTFARDKLSEEVQDEIRTKIGDLRKQLSRRR